MNRLRNCCVVGVFCLAFLTLVSATSAEDLPGIVVDDVAAEKSGPWKASRLVAPFVGEGYLSAVAGSRQSIRYRLPVREAGKYQVLVSYSASGNRSQNVPIVIQAADGTHTVSVDQRQAPNGPYGFHPLGEFTFSTGEAVVTIETGEGTRAVIADAVQFLTPEQFQQAKLDAARSQTPPAKKYDPVAAKPKDKTEKNEARPAPVAIAFERAKPSRKLMKLTSEKLDSLLAQHLGDLSAAERTNDEQFLRRVSLDLIGRPPLTGELDSFKADSALNKRQQVVERLLARSEYGANWANYWSDVISYRVIEPELTFLNYKTFKRWLAAELDRGAGWDEITHRVLTATGKVGDVPAATFVGFHQADRSRLAGETTRIFLGVQIQCAECHDHKFVDMPRKVFHEVAAYFVRTEAKLPRNDSNGIEVKSKPQGEHKIPGSKDTMIPAAFGEAKVDVGAGDLERRTELAEWIVSPDNPWFAKAYVNRIWARLMGRGFCEPMDEIGIGADPLWPDLHAAVAEHFIASGCDHRELLRLITGTRAYQRLLRESTTETKAFAALETVRLRGDEIYDSLAAAVELPNVAAPQGKENGAFRFPPPPKSTRDLVNDAFGYDPSLSKGSLVRGMPEAMFLMNNEQLQKQIDARPESGTVLARLLTEHADDAVVVKHLYRRVLAREPNERELKIALGHISKIGDRRAATEDLLWSLINSAEFTTRR